MPHFSQTPSQTPVVKANGTTEDTVELLTFEQTADDDGEVEGFMQITEESSETSEGLTHQGVLEDTELSNHLDRSLNLT